MSNGSVDVTEMLLAYSKGNREALDTLLPHVYDELRRIAARYLSYERPDHTLQPTALVHEAYLRLVNQHSLDWRNRAQFYGVAANIMRRILVNHAEAKHADKRGARDVRVPLEEEAALVDQIDVDLLALDEALERLAVLDIDKVRLVEMKFFAGMTIQEIAAITGKSTASVEREWAFTRGWLFKALGGRNEEK